MSNQQTPPGDDEWIEANRERIEREANSDAADAWVFQALLQSVGSSDSVEGGSA